MLYLAPPYHIIQGVAIFRDHADPLQRYFMPSAPKLTRLVDERTGALIPQISLIKYRGEAGNGGFLNFDCNIGLEPDKLQQIAVELQGIERLRDLPRLAPVPLVDGNVRMMLLGKQTPQPTPPQSPGAPPPPPAPTGPQFVVKIDQAAKPALYGDNQAAFSVQLDEAGVVIVEQALQGEMSPIGVIYSLDYLALRPAYSVRVNADWDRVQKHLQESFGFDLLVFSSDVTKVVDELVDSRVITIEADSFIPEGEDSPEMGRRDQALDEVRDMVLNAFFEPSLDPVPAERDNQTIQDLQSVSQLFASGGWGMPKFKMQNIDYQRLDKKVLNVNISERTTVKRSMFPQGHLSGLARPIRDEGLDLSQFIQSVTLDDPYFKHRKLNVISRASYDADAIESVSADLQYGAEVKSVLLEPAATRSSVEWLSIVEDGAMVRDVNVTYKVNFKNVDSSERPLALSSSPLTVIGDNLEIQPRELYTVTPVPIIVNNNFPWDRYPFVEVQVRYTDEANAIQITDSFMLDKTHAEAQWKFFARDPQRTRFQYKLIYHSSDRPDTELPWAETDAERIFISDPFPMKRTLEIIPAVDWKTVERVFVDLHYEDAANGVWVDESVEFTETDKDTHKFVVDLQDSEQRLVSYKVTMMNKNGSVIELPESATNDRRVFIRPNMKGHRIIAVRAEPSNLANKKISEIQAEMRYMDATAEVNDNFSFKSTDSRYFFEFDYVDPQQSDYEYRIQYLYLNGMTRQTDWEQTDARELIIPVK